jgi:hypothetical protein
MHTAHPLKEDEVTMGAGFSATLPLPEQPVGDGQTPERLVDEAAVSPGLAPWVGARLGLDGAWDAGLTYTARSARVDVRRATVVDGTALSAGVGASGLLPKRREDLGLRVGGFGADVPLLVGWKSDADIYALWLGARGGAEYLVGQHTPEADVVGVVAPDEDLEGWHLQGGGLIGFRVGFRYVYAVLEVAAAMHWAQVKIGELELQEQQFALSPAGAIVGSF